MRLGADPGRASQFPERPKGMWFRTYAKLLDMALAAEAAAHAEFVRHGQRFLVRIDGLARRNG
jgi:hypothetical protein